MDACTIVSQAEVEAAVGWEVDSTGLGAAQFAGSACNFYGKTISDLVGIAVASEGLTGRNSSSELAAFLSDTARHGMFAVDAKPVDDLGVPAARFQMGWTVVTALGKDAAGGRDVTRRGGVEDVDQEGTGSTALTVGLAKCGAGGTLAPEAGARLFRGYLTRTSHRNSFMSTFPAAVRTCTALPAASAIG